MLNKYFEEYALEDVEKLPKKRVKANKTAVLSLIRSEKEYPKMKKVKIKPLIIAAAAVITASLTLVTANAATNGALYESVSKGLALIFNGSMQNVEIEYSTDSEGNSIQTVKMGVSEFKAQGLKLEYKGDMRIEAVPVNEGANAYFAEFAIPSNIEKFAYTADMDGNVCFYTGEETNNMTGSPDKVGSKFVFKNGWSWERMEGKDSNDDHDFYPYENYGDISFDIENNITYFKLLYCADGYIRGVKEGFDNETHDFINVKIDVDNNGNGDYGAYFYIDGSKVNTEYYIGRIKELFPDGSVKVRVEKEFPDSPELDVYKIIFE